MTLKKFIKAFLAGSAFPTLFLPLAYTALYLLEPHAMRGHHLQFIPMYIPILFGITNVIFVNMNEGVPAHSAKIRLWLTGACLGFIVAVLGVFVLHVPALILGLRHGFAYLPLILVPLIYAMIFRFVVKWLNKTLAV